MTTCELDIDGRSVPAEGDRLVHAGVDAVPTGSVWIVTGTAADRSVIR